jgi:secondary thiamine-phosphate synthase enzyme
MDTTIIQISTRRGVYDITGEAAAFVSGRGDGLLSVFAEHATAGLALMEIGAGSDQDLMDTVDAILPRDDSRWRHRHGSTGHGADHVLPAFIAPSLTIPVVGGRMTLGTWQSLVLVDPNGDNPRRRVRLSWIQGGGSSTVSPG